MEPKPRPSASAKSCASCAADDPMPCVGVVSASVGNVDIRLLKTAPCVGGCRHNADINADIRFPVKVCKEREKVV